MSNFNQATPVNATSSKLGPKTPVSSNGSTPKTSPIAKYTPDTSAEDEPLVDRRPMRMSKLLKNFEKLEKEAASASAPAPRPKATNNWKYKEPKKVEQKETKAEYKAQPKIEKAEPKVEKKAQPKAQPKPKVLKKPPPSVPQRSEKGQQVLDKIAALKAKKQKQKQKKEEEAAQQTIEQPKTTETNTEESQEEEPQEAEEATEATKAPTTPIGEEIKEAAESPKEMTPTEEETESSEEPEVAETPTETQLTEEKTFAETPKPTEPAEEPQQEENAETTEEEPKKEETPEERRKREEQAKYGGQRPEKVDKLDLKKYQKISDHYGDVAAAKKSGKVQPPKPTPDGTGAPTLSATAAVAGPQVVVAQGPAETYLSEQHKESVEIDKQWSAYRSRIETMAASMAEYMSFMEDVKKLNETFGIQISAEDIPEPPILHWIPAPPVPEYKKTPETDSTNAPPPPPVPDMTPKPPLGAGPPPPPLPKIV